MKTSFNIPRQALADLLQAAGSPLTPEQFSESLSSADLYRKYPSRAWAAAMSKYFLIVVALASVIFAAAPLCGLLQQPLKLLGLDFLAAAISGLSGMDFSIENIIVAVGLCAVTFFEYRVHTYFRANDPRAPQLGFRNQSLFAGAILIYCLYHALVANEISPQDQMILVEQNNLIDAGMLKGVVRLFYFTVAVLAGGSQFGLACYYRSAQVR